MYRDSGWAHHAAGIPKIQRCKGNFGLLFQLLHRKNDIDIDHLIKMVSDSLELRGDVLAQCRRYDEMMTADRKIHAYLLLVGR